MPKKVKSSTKSSKRSFPVVGMGASAGGLAAFQAFFTAMPATSHSGMAFVLVQHLAPDHTSMLAEIIQRCTKMPVFQVTDGIIVEPNTIYVIPPGFDMALINGTLQLLKPTQPHGKRLPIDFFFNSLAQNQQDQAIGIIFSGTGNDGTQGIKAIKEAGGVVIVQAPETAEYDGMPSSAIATELADYVLAPEAMSKRLMSYTKHAFGNLSRHKLPLTLESQNILNKIYLLLRTEIGHDFSQYKPSTIQRRIQRRMALHEIDKMDEYLQYLQEFPAEIEALFQDLLIGVTNFFRDPEVFEALKTLVLPKLFEGKDSKKPIRIWSIACSSGEEAYSIAILIKEYMTEMSLEHSVQIFATDIDAQAIKVARKGIYPTSILKNVSIERLKRYFTIETNGNYRIHKSVRDMLIFSEHNIIKDPPFSQLDLISCRNLLIYLNLELQKKILKLFLYALNPQGILLLGASESIGDSGDQFTVLDPKSKIYQNTKNYGDALNKNLMKRPSEITQFNPVSMPSTPYNPGEKNLSLRALTEQLLLQKTGLSAALVNQQGDILYLHGRIGMYLELPSDEEGPVNILEMAREGLHHDLMIAFHKAVKTKKSVYCPFLSFKKIAPTSSLNLTIQPVPSSALRAIKTPLYLVIFEAHPKNISPPVTAIQETSSADAPNDNASIAALEQELYEQKIFLQISNHKLELSNNELKSFNEEMQSLNEELQSTNEELETSKEELQSVNEELSTVNAELQIKVVDLSHANNDMNNLLAGTNIGTVFVDHNLSIMRFTPSIKNIINLIQSDIGRPISHITSMLINYPHFLVDIQSVLDSLIPKKIDVQTQEGVWYSMSIQPYRTLENVIEGAVIAFVEITEIVEMRESLLAKTHELERLAVIVSDAYDAITVQDLKGTILAWNPAAVRIYGWNESEALKMQAQDRIPPEHYAEELARIDKLINLETLEPYRAPRLTQEGLTIIVWITATALINSKKKVYAIATTERPTKQELKGKGNAKK
jgi:two-component system CheB/CheR fusion protein